MGKTQREYVLRQQLDAIRKELGETPDESAEGDRLRERVEAAGMPEDALKQARRELDRLANTPPASAEHGVIRTYLEWMVDLPWAKTSEDRLDVAAAKQILDEGPLRPREGEGPHPRVHRGAVAEARSEGARSSASRVRPVPARRRSAARSHARSAASSCASRSAACATRPRSAATAAPMSARCRGA
jgi:hypothetical protein